MHSGRPLGGRCCYCGGMNYSKGFALPLVFLVIVVLLIGGYWYQHRSVSQEPVRTATSTSGLQTYLNSQYKFSFQYPSSVKVEAGCFTGGIPNPGETDFCVRFLNHPVDGPDGVETLLFTVQPASNTYPSAEQMYQARLKVLGSQGFTVQKFTIGADEGVLDFKYQASTPGGAGESCSNEIHIFHAGYDFEMPAPFGPVFALQTKIQDCLRNLWTVSDDYINTLKSFKFLN